MASCLLSDGKGNASIRGGVFENEYVREDGNWKIGVHRYYPAIRGPYETGWTNWQGSGPGDPSLSLHAGRKRHSDSAARGRSAQRARPRSTQLEERIAVMNDEGLVRNLQAAYGYYVNRRMWDDVTDLFAGNGVYEFGGVGIYAGNGVRKAHGAHGSGRSDAWRAERSPAVRHRRAASRRAAAKRMCAASRWACWAKPTKARRYWEVSVFDNRFVKEDGIWKVREMRVFPIFRSDYSEGWGKSRIVEAARQVRWRPTSRCLLPMQASRTALVPAFVSTHPVTGKPIAAPAGMKLVATSRSLARSPRRWSKRIRRHGHPHQGSRAQIDDGQGL